MVSLNAAGGGRSCHLLRVLLVIMLATASGEEARAGESAGPDNLAANTSKAEIVRTQDTLNTHYNFEKDKLLFTHVLYRHGDRMPVGPYKTDPWKDRKFWPTGWGQLTNIGKLQQYELGEWLRKRYQKTLLSEEYNKDEIFVQSTDMDRTLMSALANLAGLYPPKRTDVWNNDISWQPIPVHTLPQHLDYILAAKVPCPSYEALLTRLERSDFYQDLYQRYSYLLDYLSEFSGAAVHTFDDVQRINNTLYIEQLYNKTLPEWTKKVFPSADMSYVSALTFQFSTYTRPMARLKVGPLIREMLERFAHKAQGNLRPNRNVWMYSAHDTTVVSVLNALKVYEVHSPPYAACILLEMRLNDQNKPYISVFYRNSSQEPSALSIPNCGVACPLDRMFDLHADILPRNWQEECEMIMFDYDGTSTATSIGIIVTVITILIFLMYVAIVYGRRRSYSNYIPYTQVA